MGSELCSALPEDMKLTESVTFFKWPFKIHLKKWHPWLLVEMPKSKSNKFIFDWAGKYWLWAQRTDKYTCKKQWYSSSFFFVSSRIVHILILTFASCKYCPYWLSMMLRRMHTVHSHHSVQKYLPRLYIYTTFHLMLQWSRPVKIN